MTMTTGVVLVNDATQTCTAIAGFLAGYCGSTRRSYATDLRLFAGWCGETNVPLFDVRRAHLELFGRWMEENGKMRSTVARRLSTLASFSRYCEQGRTDRAQPCGQRPPAQGRLRVAHPRPRPQRARRLLGPSRPRLWPRPCPGLAAGPQRPAHLRAAGRRHRRPRVRTWSRTLKILRKGGKRAVIPAGARTSRALDLYIGERTTGPIFLGAKGERMDRYAADRMVKRLARRAGITKRISPYSLRHSFITAVLDAGVPLRDVQGAASHADPRALRPGPGIAGPSRHLHRRHLPRRRLPLSPMAGAAPVRRAMTLG
ncbi:MAG TPA: tyrosine-type recombinase/integrase [Acidimicrobiales bacterium]|nr:tyrosine-type recombinase/integrase [Acidimicrobiales bacterium]